MKFGGTSVADADAIAPADRRSCTATQRRRVDAPPVVVVSATSRRDRSAARAGAAAPQRGDGRRRRAASIACSSGTSRSSHGADDRRARADARGADRARELDDLRARADGDRDPARVVAALARRGRRGRRARQQPHRRRGARGRRACRRPGSMRARALVTDDAAHGGRAAGDRDRARRSSASSCRTSPPGACRSSAASSARRATASRRRSAAAGRTTRRRSSAPCARTSSEIQIWTDVDGMLTADPARRRRDRASCRSCRSPKRRSWPTSAPRCCTRAPSCRRSSKNIPVRILNSRRPEAPGTLITAEPPPADRPLAALACKRDVTVVDITSTRMLMAHGFLRRLFEVFERYRTPVDVVTTSEVSVSVTVDDDRRLDDDRRRRCGSSPR